MISKVVQIGDKIDLVKLERTRNYDTKVAGSKKYVSQLLEFMDGNKAKIAMPIYNSKVVLLDVDDRYHMCFYTARGTYQCKAVITDRQKEGRMMVLVVEFLTNIEKFQRREYYRLERIMDITYRLYTKEEEVYLNRIEENKFTTMAEKVECLEKLKILQSNWMPATITDISGGGARFNTGYQSESGDKIILNIMFQLNVNTYDFKLKSLVISSRSLMNREGLYENRVEFIEIDMKQRETLIKFIFEEERKMRRREKGLI